MGLIIGGVSPQDLIMDGHSVSLYVGGNPPVKVWPTWGTVQITLGAGYQARDQFRAALSDRGLDYATITEVPFEIELVGSGNAQQLFYGCSDLRFIPPLDTSQVTNTSGMFQMCSSLVTVPPLDTRNVWNAPSMFAFCSSLTSVPAMDTSSMTNMDSMFWGCSSLTHVPDMDTSSVTNMSSMFRVCSSLTHVPEMDTSQVTNMSSMFRLCPSLTYVPDMDTAQVTDVNNMFYNCAALTDGNVRLIGRHPQVDTTNMIDGSGLTREPFYDADGQPWPTDEVHEVTLDNVSGIGTVHPLVTVTVPAGETWSVRIQGTVTVASDISFNQPMFRIGTANSGRYGQGAAVDFSGTVTAANSVIAMVTSSHDGSSFSGTVTIEK